MQILTGGRISALSEDEIHYDQIKMLIFSSHSLVVESLLYDDEYCLCVMMISFPEPPVKKDEE